MTRLEVSLVLLALASSIRVCSGQRLTRCDTGLPDTVTCGGLTPAVFLGKGGRQLASGEVLYEGHLLISRLCSLGDGVVLVGFGNQHSNGEAFTVTCREPRTSPFNSYRQGVRDGLWFHHNLLGRITHVADYQAGEVRSVLQLWSNGLPRRRIFYSRGKPHAAGMRRYTKQGYPRNGLVPF